MKKLTCTSILISVFVVTGFVCSADTYISGIITNDATWAATNNPYVVLSSTYIDNGAVLTIHPGVEVRFQPLIGLLVGDGTLLARGTADSNIIFTANQSPPDDPTNRWAFIRLLDNATDARFDADGIYTSGCIFEYVDVAYAGGASDQGAIIAEESSPFIHYCTFHDNYNGAIYCSNSPCMNFTANYISNNTLQITTPPYSMVRLIGDYPLVRSNRFIRNLGTPLSMDGYKAVVEDNVFSYNSNTTESGEAGCVLFYSDNSTIRSNVLTDNICSFGFNANGSNVLIKGNTIISNSVSGIHFTGIDVQITDNFIMASGHNWTHGGGIYASGTSMVIEGNIIKTNTTTEPYEGAPAYGAGIYVEGYAIHIQSNDIMHNKVIGNAGGFGGGLAVAADNVLVAGNCIISNQSPYGGGVNLYGKYITLTNNNISYNYSARDGAGIALNESKYIHFTDNKISRNTALQNGGAIRSYWCSDICQDYCDIEENAAASGGAFYLFDSSNYHMMGNTIYSNTATSGSVIYMTGQVQKPALSTNPACPTRIIGNTGQYQIYDDCSFTSFDDPAAPGNLDARNVWWGTTTESTVSTNIYDFLNNSSKGHVIYDPMITWSLTLNNYGGGSTSNNPSGLTFNEMDVITLYAMTSNYWYFSSWSNNVAGASLVTNITITGNMTADAYFAPFVATQGVPLYWLIENGLGTNDQDVLADSDGDQAANWEEWYAGTEPTNIWSVFEFEQTDKVTTQSWVRVTWSSADNKTYTLSMATNLLYEFAVLSTNIPATPPVNTWFDMSPASGRKFYRVGVNK